MFRNLIIVLAVVMGILMAVVVPASGITYGVPDNDEHPNVGMLAYEDDEGELFGLCSGTLISSKVFLTAGHCTAYLTLLGVSHDKVWVSFDPEPGISNFKSVDCYITNPAYYIHSFAAESDLGVVILDDDTGITPAELPAAGLLGDMGPRGLRHQQFTAVGYGSTEPSIGHGPPVFEDPGIRMVATSTFSALNKNWLRLSGNYATGNGGTCYGDSGGPNFLGTTNTIAGITVTGDSMCLATNVVLRLDTDAALNFLKGPFSCP
jgi:hypothetical protein